MFLILETISALPYIQFIKEINEIFNLNSYTSTITCTIYEDNSEFISMELSNKFTPLTKHISLKYHHFKDKILQEIIILEKINTENKISYILTKPLTATIFKRLRLLLMGC